MWFIGFQHACALHTNGLPIIIKDYLSLKKSVQESHFPKTFQKLQERTMGQSIILIGIANREPSRLEVPSARFLDVKISRLGFQFLLQLILDLVDHVNYVVKV